MKIAPKDSLWENAPKKILTTGIGSLPHANADSAIHYSFQHAVPFLPQLPMRHAYEFMIPQTLDGLPGLIREEGGHVNLDLDRWNSGTHALKVKLSAAFEENFKKETAFEAFLPNAESYRCWEPFLWELEEQKIRFAKIQIAGSLSCQWILKLSDGSLMKSQPEISAQISRLVLAKAIAMVRKLRARGIQPLVYIDEPALFGFTGKNTQQALGLLELKLMIQALQKESALVGIHCCSDIEWAPILGLGLDALSVDTDLSFQSLLKAKNELSRFLSQGGRLSLGVVPTQKSVAELSQLSLKERVSELGRLMEKAQMAGIDQHLRSALYTASCGLALQSIEVTEFILSALQKIGKDVFQSP